MKHLQEYTRNFKLAYPVMLGSLGQTTVMLADSVMVGQTGHIPLAAVSLSNAIFYAPMVFGMGIAFGITPLVANAEGAGNRETSVRVLKNGLLIALLSALLLSGFILLLVSQLHHFKQDILVVVEATPYLMLLVYSILPFLIFMALKQFAEGLSDTKAAMRVSLTANILNVALNYVLIFGKWGFPEMGLLGAGWATLISRVFQAVAMGAWLWWMPKFSEYREIWLQTTIKGRYLKDVLEIGVPTGLQAIFEVSAFAMASIIIGTIGAKEQAAHQIAISLASMSYMLAQGLSAAATIRVSGELGRRQFDALKLAMRTILRMVILLGLMSGLIFILGRNFLPGLFTEDPKVIQIAAMLLIITAIFQLSDGVQVVALGALRGFSDVRMPTLITFLAYWAVALPLGYVLGKHTAMGTMGVWTGLAVGLTVAAGWLWLRYHRRSMAL
jgi:multidrug resistance protein, MATE family